MTRIFVDRLPVFNNELSQEASQYLIDLDADLTHHLRDVLRLDEGKQLTVVCRESGLEFLAIVASAIKSAALKIQIVKKLDRQIASPVVSTLICGLPKGSHSDQICEQVSQLGVKNIVFWCAERSVSQPKQVASKLDRWQKIAEASARQSKQNSIPKLSYFNSSLELYSWLERDCISQGDILALCALTKDAQPISSIDAASANVIMVVGPEGDFSAAELINFDKLGAKQITLGPLVLRVETAALVAVSMGLATWGWRYS